MTSDVGCCIIIVIGDAFRILIGRWFQIHLEGLEDPGEDSGLVALLGLVDDEGRLVGHVARVAVHVVARLCNLEESIV